MHMEVFITLKTTGIIVEYNPLHPGHIYHMEQARKQTGADYLIAVMSGSFVQRGAPALLDKYTRTRMALLAGADVVIELPVCFATGSAGDLAAGAVSLLDKLGCVDGLCFGSESGDISLFEKTATLLQCESAAFSNALKKALKSGLSFPAARQQALLLCLDMAKDMPSTACPDNNSTAEQIVALLSSPNNLLGLEYTLALLRRNSSIRPFTISRVGSGYHDPLDGAADFPSASALRSLLAKQGSRLFCRSCSAIPNCSPCCRSGRKFYRRTRFYSPMTYPVHCTIDCSLPLRVPLGRMLRSEKSLPTSSRRTAFPLPTGATSAQDSRPVKSPTAKSAAVCVGFCSLFRRKCSLLPAITTIRLTPGFLVFGRVRLPCCPCSRKTAAFRSSPAPLLQPAAFLRKHSPSMKRMCSLHI